MKIRFCPRRKGFTLVEMMVAVAISSTVAFMLYDLQILSGRAIKEVYGQTRTRSSRMIALDQVRYRLCEAKISSITVSQKDSTGTAYNRIDFTDPNLGGAKSAFYFTTATKTLYYDANTADGQAAEAVAIGPINVSFELQSAGAIVVLRVRSSEEMSFGDVDTEDGVTCVYVRNT